MNNDRKGIWNLGLMAHVDAGKTTLTENMLFLSGAIKTIGSVDKGASQTDSMEVERRRGITVQSSSVYFDWQDDRINLIDTPGHADFSAEVERSLRAVDCAVLLISAVEGIQAQTEAIWNALSELKIPLIIFINKIDRVGSDFEKVVSEIKKEFSPDLALLSKPEREGSSEANAIEILSPDNIELIETIAAHDDELLERYLNDDLPDIEEIRQSMRRSVNKRELFPVICGAAKTSIGVKYLLNSITAFLQQASAKDDGPVSGLVFKITHDDRLGRIAAVRLFSGSISPRDNVINASAGREEKITQIKRSFSGKYEDIDKLRAGDIAYLCGMPEVRVGDILGDPSIVPGNYSISEPLLTVQANPVNTAEYSKLAAALQMLSGEDPQLNFVWYKEDQQLQLKIMGPIQIEILTEILSSRFGLETEFSKPEIIYKETPSATSYGIERYTMPKPCWAVLKLRIEPGTRGSGIFYESALSTDNIQRKYQHEIEMTIPKALKQGIKGWEVTDIKITLVDGEDHVMHSNPGDFKLATPIAVMNGLTNTGTDLMEPILEFSISAPEQFLGKVSGDIIGMRGNFEPVIIDNSMFVLKGKFPLATSMDYSIRLNSMTGGKVKYTAKFCGYEKCPADEEHSRPYKGISPLDRSKYILMMRGAINQK